MAPGLPRERDLRFSMPIPARADGARCSMIAFPLIGWDETSSVEFCGYYQFSHPQCSHM